MLQARKAPKQKRAKDRISSILNAAKDILARDGYSEFSTNKVAKAALVNIASVYQYFPNKESLIYAIHQQISQQIEEHCQLHEQRWSMEAADLIHSLYQDIFGNMEFTRLLQAVECAIITTPSLNHLQSKITEQLARYIERLLQYHGCQWNEQQRFKLGQLIHQISSQFYFDKSNHPNQPRYGDEVVQHSRSLLVNQAFTAIPSCHVQDIVSSASDSESDNSNKAPHPSAL